MTTKAATTDQYLMDLPEDRKAPMLKFVETLRKNLPAGFEETIQHGMISFVVPHSRYPAGYHCDPKQPLPFISIASQKNFIALYHMGIYANTELLNWFTSEYPKHVKGKLDMGKSCIRFKKPEQIPFGLLEELAGKMSPKEWIALYEEQVKG